MSRITMHGHAHVVIVCIYALPQHSVGQEIIFNAVETRPFALLNTFISFILFYCVIDLSRNLHRQSPTNESMRVWKILARYKIQNG
jgi:hypothetical protein